jgi:hypothetical protein
MRILPLFRKEVRSRVAPPGMNKVLMADSRKKGGYVPTKIQEIYSLTFRQESIWSKVTIVG